MPRRYQTNECPTSSGGKGDSCRMDIFDAIMQVSLPYPYSAVDLSPERSLRPDHSEGKKVVIITQYGFTGSSEFIDNGNNRKYLPWKNPFSFGTPHRPLFAVLHSAFPAIWPATRPQKKSFICKIQHWILLKIIRENGARSLCGMFL